MALFVNDTFSGAVGPLMGHTGELGASWDKPGFLVAIPRNDIRLTGGGAVQLQYDEGIRYYDEAVASGAPLGADYYVEIDFTAAAPTGGNINQVTCFMRAGFGYPNYIEVTMMPSQGGGGYPTSSEAWIGDASTGSYSSNISGPAYTGSHTFRAEIEGLTARMYLDGDLLASFAVTRATAGSVGFAFATDGPDGLVVNAFRAGTLGTTPSAFWTEFKGATEALA